MGRISGVKLKVRFMGRMESISKRTTAPVPSAVCSRGEHGLADGEGDVGVGDGGVVWVDVDFGGIGIQVDGNRITFDFGMDREVTEKFYGKYPGFEGAFLLAEEDAARAGDGEGLAGLDAVADGKASGDELDCGDGGELSILRKCGRAGKRVEER